MVSALGRGKSTRFGTQPSKACTQIVGVAQTLAGSHNTHSLKSN